MASRHGTILARIAITGCVLLTPVVGADDQLPRGDTLMKAMVAELDRSMKNLLIDDLPRPYFIQYRAEDRLALNMNASRGALIRSDDDRYRTVTSRVRVGSYALDNTNIGRGFGRRASLPLDDDETAIRHAIWHVTDADYKQAVEALTRKQAHLKQKNIVDRPEDFTSTGPVRLVEPSARFNFDRKTWEADLERLSARLKECPEIQYSGATLFAGAVNEWIVNSEGTRLDTGIYLGIRAQVQADDGMRLSDSRSYLGLQTDDLPPVQKMLTDIDEMSRKLVALSRAPLLEHYAGPVLFDSVAAGMVFEALLGDGLCARPIPVGSGGWANTSLEKKIGQRILPRSFQVYDDPRAQRFGDTILAGAYTYDDEAVAPTRVDLVQNGILKTLLASRAPSKKIKRSTGHGRGAASGDARANIGCLYISDDNGVPEEQLEQLLIAAAKEEGLAFGLHVESIEPIGSNALGDPIYAYKVYVDDGRKELIRGLNFLPVETRSLKHILGSGTERKVYNSTSGIPASVIAPRVLFEELELTKIEEEFDKRPYLKPPAQRTN
jgi:predicted Zn-dependent protease